MSGLSAGPRVVLRKDVRRRVEEGASRAGAATVAHDLVVQDLGARYGDQAAVRGVGLEAPAGSCVAILGANGAGKSTLLSAISGLHRPVRGTIRFAGARIDHLPAHRLARRGICHVPEGRGIFPDLSVADNLHLFLGRDDEAFERVVTQFPLLKPRLGQRAGSLSGGEQQMLAMAPAVAGRYRLLMVDELSLGLAPVIVDALFALLADVRRGGASVVVVEQFAERALALAERAYVLRKGEVVYSGDAATLRGREDYLRFLYLGGRS